MTHAEPGIEERAKEARAFFRSLYDDTRTLLPQAEMHNRGKPFQTMTEPSSRLNLHGDFKLLGWLSGRMEMADRGVELFFCPTVMSEQSGRKKYQVLPSRVAFSDADYGLTPAAHRKLTQLGAGLNRSGGITEDGRPKYHIYLRLSTTVDLATLEKINRGLKIFVNGDKFDATSLLRIPGTRNHKYRAGGPDGDPTSAPLVRVERYATATHTPESLLAEFPIPTDIVLGVELEGLKLPEVPGDFQFSSNAPGYFRVRKTVRNFNSMFEAGNLQRRYAASIAIVRESIKAGLSVDVAYAFAEHCKPLQDKEQEEDGYSIRKDIARTYYRETKAPSTSSNPDADDTLTVSDVLAEATRNTFAAPVEPAADERHVAPAPTFKASDMAELQLGEGFPFARPNLDDLLSDDYVPLEPTLVPCGSYFLLYPGKSHGLSSDRGVGKTNTTIAMIHSILKTGGRVAYFDFEDSADTFIRDRMMNQHGITEQMIRTQFLYLGGIMPLEIDGMSPTDAIEFLAEQIQDWDLVVVDGVAASMADWSVEDDPTKPQGMLDGNKPNDYAWWYKRQIQPFLNRGITTLQIDHSTKTGGRVSGTLQKGAKFTGVEYELRAEKVASNLVMGGTGRLILSAAKDRVGRILRYKRRHVSAEEPESYNDVAVFVMTSDINGHVTRAAFEPVNDSVTSSNITPASTPLSDLEFKILRILNDSGKPMIKSQLAKALGIASATATTTINAAIARGLIQEQKDGNRLWISPVVSAPVPEPAVPGGPRELDFTQSDHIPSPAQRTRECRKCGDYHTYPGDFAQPDDIGYNPKRPMCKACAAENIDSEPVDGAEWARKVRERITGRRRPTRRVGGNERP